MKFTRIFILLLACILAACGNDKTGGDQTQTVTPIEVDPSSNLYGLITDEKGLPISGVVVSDGFQCVVTDDKGVYQMERNENAQFVFYSVPADYKVNLSIGGYPTFYAKISTILAQSRHDFTLQKIAKETNFTLIAVGDPQVKNEASMNRFVTESMAAVKKTAQASQYPCYALMLGDITDEKQELLSNMVGNMYASGVPYWAVIGNHDKIKYSDETLPRNADKFMSLFGPLTYSFNRGDVHFVCLDNVRYSSGTSYSGGLTTEQLEWLEQDLSHVDKDKMIIVFYHIPIRNNGGSYDRLFELMQGYASVHFMCGHTHTNENHINTTSRGSIYEHIHGTPCGAWWNSTINVDGTPNGYAVYDVRGNEIVNWYYKGALYDDEKYQIRLHKGDDEFPASSGTWYRYSDINSMIGEGTVIANVFNADAEWDVRLYENGVDKGKMDLISAAADRWSQGYHIGILGRSPNSYGTTSKTLYYKQRTAGMSDSAIKVVATDRFGNVYEQTKFTAQDDFSDAIAPQ